MSDIDRFVSELVKLCKKHNMMISAQDLDNPLGHRRGQVYSWKEIRNLRLAPGLIDH